MQLYVVGRNSDDQLYVGTRAEAHELAKNNWHKVAWHYVRIDLVEFDADKASWLNVLNDHVPLGLKVVRTWQLTPRGGLMETKED